MSERADLCNIALGILGESAITSIDDDSEKAEILKVNYNIARDATLEAHEWSFAIKQFVPNRLSNSPEWMYGSQFQVPADILRVLAVERMPTAASEAYDSVRSSRARTRANVDHEVQGRLILCDEEHIFCTGIRRVEEEGSFSNLFCHALAAKLAMLICFRLTESSTKFDRAVGLYAGFMKEAKSRDGMQSSTRRLVRNAYAKVR